LSKKRQIDPDPASNTQCAQFREFLLLGSRRRRMPSQQQPPEE
jgi:hypothetical protein